MTDSHIHVLGISGSLRAASWNTGLLRAAAELLPATMTLEIADLSAFPLFVQDHELDPPAPVAEFRRRIVAADALLIATPEYNYSIPGVLKNAIDWVSRPASTQPFAGKPTAIVGAGGRLGTARAQYHLRQIAVFLNMHVLNKPELLIQHASTKFDATGALIDAEAREHLRAVLTALAAWTRRLRGA